MVEKRRNLKEDELIKIRSEHDLLDGNLNRMCVCNDSDELIEMFHYANLRIKNIYDICINKFIRDV